ncbi:uncharacterized protein J4E92_010543 [Alternaria infectoria]|uniref:uncharacterized protein n=1 Tax=Alternaria infectoria TaxID=45303 RepID=UPI00221FA092|nr:uncharacterized protein J4E92_010543 [Alternaria infectoria]KAI4909772.1 hypothetical protein J4E92_010543 [Alternaria infectoria]
MAKLTDLSNELLYSIVAHLETGRWSDVRALWQLCKTSRALAAVAQPALYTCVVLGQSMPETMRSLELFLRTCVERPKLAKKTRSLTLHYHRPAPYKGPDLMRHPTFSEFSKLWQVQNFDSERNVLYQTLVLYTLLCLPNLRHLRMDTHNLPPRGLLQGMHAMRASSDAFLARLETFHFAEFQEDMEQHGEDSFHYVYPSFRDFEMLSHITMQFGKLTKLCHLPESLKCLKLQDCHFDVDLSEDCLRGMLKLKDTWCPLIEHLSLQGFNVSEAIDMIREVARSVDLRIFESLGKGLVSFSSL